MKLADLQTGEYGIITKVKGIGAFRKRIMEMGFIRGKKVLVVKNAPLNDPIEYNIMGYEVSLRRSEAALIEVITEAEAREFDALASEGLFKGVFTEAKLRKTAIEHGKIINIAMVGNPNAGKTSLFNHASNSKEHVGNFAGVTVDSKTATVHYKGYTLNITDLPGTYSLTTYSPEELYVRNFIAENHPDVIINVVDASNLERNLYLTTQLIDMDVKVVMALNMFDELQRLGHQFDYNALGLMIGVPIIPTVGSKGKGIKELFDKVINIFTDKDTVRRHVHIHYGEDVEKSILKLRSLIKDEINHDVTLRFSSRFLAIKLLEKDQAVHSTLSQCANYEEIKAKTALECKRLESAYLTDCETILTDAKYGFIDGALLETYKGNLKNEKRRSVIIDKILTNKYLGFPIFLLFLWIMFQTTFTLGNYPMEWIDLGVHRLSAYLQTLMPEGSLKDLVIDGIFGGVGGVLVFLPNILLLFFFISIMEDTGYMARAAFIMDKIMHKVGLHGKSFIPLIMGFGCNVPAVMSTRIIENPNSRKVTMLINPFFSCSARLPVYVLIISVFAPKNPGFILFSLYVLGIVIAAVLAFLFRKFLFKKNEVPFVMELPPYRIPNPKTTLRHTWHKGQQYLQKMGGVILTASIIIWALGYFPRNVNYSKNYDKEIVSVKESYQQQIAKAQSPALSDSLNNAKNLAINAIVNEREAERQQFSYAGRIGHFFEPIMAPLGFDWRMSVALMSGIAAKEVIISTMGVLYQSGDGSGDNERLIKRLQACHYQDGNHVGKLIFTPVTSLAFLVFILIYFPCIAVITAIGKESGSWKMAVFEMTYTTVLAWLLAFAVYQIGSLIIGG
jgi:ferrous iron transport protein B